MAYAQIHTQAPRHPKLLPLSDAAWRLWATGLCYVQEHLTDGKIPRSAVQTFGVRASKSAAATLVRVGLWHADGDDFRVHDYADWNHTRDEVAQRQTAKKARWARWKARKAAEGEACADASTDASANAFVDASPTRSPTRPQASWDRATQPQPQPQPQPQVQDQERTSPAATTPAPTDDGFATFWDAYPRHEAKPKAQRVWKALKPSPRLQELILVAIADQRTWRQWREGFIPHPATWLQQKRWDDERPPDERTPTNRAPAEFRPWCEHDPPCHTQPEHTAKVLAEGRAQREAVPA